jgi:hypothetical protein
MHYANYRPLHGAGILVQAVQPQLSLDDDVCTMQALVRRWQRALEQGQISQMDLAMAIGAIDEVLADVRALIQVEETVQ